MGFILEKSSSKVLI